MRLFKTATTLFSALALLVGALFGALQTSVVQKKICQVASSYAKERGVDLSIEKISGSFPFSFTLALTIERENGEKIHLNDLRVQIHPLLLLRGEISGNMNASITTIASQNLEGFLQGELCLKSNSFAAKIEGRNLKTANEALPPLCAKVHASKEEGKWKGKVEFIPST